MSNRVGTYRLCKFWEFEIEQVKIEFSTRLDQIEQVKMRLIFQHHKHEVLTGGPAKPQRHAKYQLKVQCSRLLRWLVNGLFIPGIDGSYL